MTIENNEIGERTRALRSVENFIAAGGCQGKSPAQIGRDALSAIWKDMPDTSNGKRPKPPKTLSPACLARLLREDQHIIIAQRPDKSRRRVDDEAEVLTETSTSESLAVYVASTGIYTTDERHLASLAAAYVGDLSAREFEEIKFQLWTTAPRKAICDDPDLIALKNGIFNYATGELMPFSSDVVFLHKAPVAMPDSPPVNPVIDTGDGTTWDVDSWLAELADSDDQLTLFWQLLGAALRPTARWDKCVLLYSTTGNNGKGTFCELLTNLVGHGGTAFLNIENFASRFGLESLLTAQLVIGHENATNAFMSDAAAFKAAVTGDIVQIDRKHQPVISMRFQGLIVECINELPRFADKTGSLARRFLFVPFSKRFEGRENKSIKQDYLARQEVLEYVLWKCLRELPKYTEFTLPPSSSDVMMEWSEVNDPVRQFAAMLNAEATWELLPHPFVFDLYKAWMRDENPSGKPESKRAFERHFADVMKEYPDWQKTPNPVGATGRLDKPELLILQYDLRSWMNETYLGPDPRLRASRPDFAGSKFRGWLRTSPVGGDAA